jgi:hypothetical protein
MVTGFVALAQTVLAPGSAGNAATATGIAQAFVGPRGTAITRVDPRKLSTNDVVAASPRGTVPLGTSQISFSHGRVASVGTASAVIELTFTNPNTASATLVANTWNLSIQLQGADL